jgi:hypothetical protein
MFGALLLVSLRLLGVAFANETPGRTLRALRPLLWSGGACVAISGLVLLASGAVKNYYNPAFRWKIALLIPALALSMWMDRTVRNETASRLTGAVAVLTMILWCLVAMAGRAIGFV